MEEKLLFGKYLIKGKLGQGGMAIVYHAYDPTLKRDIAIKALLPKFKKNVDVVKMFIREGQIMAQLDDPHIVKVYENAKYNDFFFYVMEYINGKTLKQLMERGMSFDENEVIFKEILRALSYIHEKKILHMDLKPSNIMIENSGKIKITDFGIGVDIDKDILKKDTLIGTIKYIAPEQIKGDKVGYHTDIYQLGIILYELYAGEAPFLGENEEIVKAKTTEPPEPLSSRRHLVPEYISSVCMRMLRTDPNDRYKTVDEVIEEMDSLKSYSITDQSYSDYHAGDELIVKKVYAVEEFPVEPVKKKKKKVSFFNIFRGIILFLFILLALVSMAVWQAEKLGNFPLSGIFVDIKAHVISNYGVFNQEDSIAYALWCQDHSEYPLAEDILLALKDRFPGSKYDVNKRLFDLYYITDEKKFIEIASEVIKYSSRSDRYFIYKRLGHFYKAKGEKVLSSSYFKKAIVNAQSEDMKAEIYKIMK
ncbi:serine/threonine protein kinase [bacterium]|nr:serine/threonine protein kinase [bacterium]